jgi:hypothetical protein
MVKYVATIKGDRAATHRILTDFAKYIEWYPECEKCDVIATSGTKTDVDLTLGGMKVARMVLRFDCQPDSISYSIVNSQDLKGFTGSYKIVDGGGDTHTVMMEVDLTASVPKFVTDRMMKSSLEKQAKQLQERNARYAAPSGATAAASLDAPSATTAPRPAAGPAKRPRCLLRVRKNGEGVSIWYAGSEYHKTK